MFECPDRVDECPNCRQSYEIAAVNLSLFKPTAVLFVCPACGLTRTENAERVVARKIRRSNPDQRMPEGEIQTDAANHGNGFNGFELGPIGRSTVPESSPVHADGLAR